MKKLITWLAGVGAVATLAGCAVVPYGAPYPAYGGGYAPQPVQPIYGPAYAGPPVYLGFSYRGGGRGHYRRGWR